MKKRLITILSIVAILFAVSVNTQAQMSVDLSPFVGYSWTSTGVVGLEAQFGLIGLSGGWTPTKYPGSGDPLSSFSGSISIQTKTNEYMNNAYGADGACWYGSFGIATNGYRSQYSYNGGAWTDNYSQAMYIAMLGVKSYQGRWTFKVGGGYGWCSVADSFAWEVGFGYALFSNHN